MNAAAKGIEPGTHPHDPGSQVLVGERGDPAGPGREEERVLEVVDGGRGERRVVESRDAPDDQWR
jgi:hypothetical protein